MRFKAKLVPEQLSLLYQVLVPMARIAASSSSSNECVSTNSVWTKNSAILHLDDSYFRVSTKGKSTDTDGIQCFAEFATRDTSGGNATVGIFVDHRIESAAPGNAIAMEIDLAQLRLALQSLVQEKKKHASNMVIGDQHYTVLKLAKRNNVPCLCLDSFTYSGTGGDASGSVSNSMPIQVHHSISVRIMRVSDMIHYGPPKLGRPPDIQLELPLDRPIKGVMEGLKALGSTGSSSTTQTVSLHATTRGELTISLDSDGASIRAFFNHLRVHHNANPDADNASSSSKQEARVKVDTKKLCTCMQWQQSSVFPVSSALLCLLENELLVVHVSLQPSSVGFQTYYIPIHYLAPDEEEEENGY